MRLLFAIGLGLMFMAGGAVFAEEPALKDQKDKVSYSIGIDIGNNIKKQGIEINTDALAQGIRDGFFGNKPLLTEQEMKEIKMAFQKEMVDKQLERSKVAGAKNKKEADVFLSENKKKEGVVTLPSGLQYKVITEGKGNKPKATDKVTVNYKGTFIDGTEFDSSYKRGQAATFGVNQVIAGWTEALQLMAEGSKWQLFIPSSLAYGEQGTPGGPIGPNATLIFEVELLSIGNK